MSLQSGKDKGLDEFIVREGGGDQMSLQSEKSEGLTQKQWMNCLERE